MYVNWGNVNMKNSVKTLGFIISISFLLIGCSIKSKNTNEEYYPTPTNQVMKVDFNEEVYVWENFVFSTNRVLKTM